MTTRAQTFRYTGLTVLESELVGHYELDGRTFTERVTFEGPGDLRAPAPSSVSELWYLLAGLSYYKAGAAHTIDLGTTPVGAAGRALLAAAVREGLAEFAYRNNLWLEDVTFVGGVTPSTLDADVDLTRVLTPFGGGIDSVVTVRRLSRHVDQALFVMSPPSGRFAPLEATAALMERPIRRVTRHLDPTVLAGDPSFFNGHVPVTAMVTLLACVSALAEGRGGVVMSNEHSASVPNLRWDTLDVNHQWSKSWVAEVLLGEAVAERVGDTFTVASFLRDRSELWVARELATCVDVLPVFRSCNRAFRQDAAARAANWCGECDKCLFIALVLAPFVSRATLDEIFGGPNPLGRPEQLDNLRTLVGLGSERKPFECVGDPGECAVALRAVVELPEWRDDVALRALADEVENDLDLAQLLQLQGPSRVPAAWLR